jgi:hypothetical protein
MVTSEPEQQLAITRDGHCPTGFATHVQAAAPTHLVELVATLTEISDRGCDAIRSAGSHYHATSNLGDKSGGVAFCLGRDDDGAGRGHDPLEPTRHDVACEARGEADEVHVRGREARRNNRRRLVRKKADSVSVDPFAELTQNLLARTIADDDN